MKPDNEPDDSGGLFEMPDDPIQRPPQPFAQCFGDWVALVAMLAFVGFLGR